MKARCRDGAPNPSAPGTARSLCGMRSHEPQVGVGYASLMPSEASIRRLRRLAESERARESELYELLADGASLSKRDILGMEPGPHCGAYPAGLIVDDFLSLALAVNETVVVGLPALLTVEEFEESLGVPFGGFLDLIDRGAILPILGDYESYVDPQMVLPIVNQPRPHYTEQRVVLSLLANNGLRWPDLVEGLARAEEVLDGNSIAVSRERDLGDEVHIQGVHVGYAKLYALGYGPALDDLVARFGSDPDHEMFEAVRRLADDGHLTGDFLLFALTTYLSNFFADCVSLGAMGQFDLSYEAIIRLPSRLRDAVDFLPVSFGQRLVQWLDIDVPRRLEHAELDWLMNSNVREAIATKISKFKAEVERADYLTAVDTGARMKEEFDELNRAYRRLNSLKKFGAFASKVSFAAVPITGSALAGLLGGPIDALAALGLTGASSVVAKTALAQIEEDEVLARRIFNPLLARIAPWRMDAATYQLCELRAAASDNS